MKKSMKKLTALLLAMVMVLAMGLTSFAASVGDDGKIPVSVTIEKDGTSSTQVVRLSPNASLYTQAEGETIENYNKATAFDALLAANVVTGSHTVQYLDTATWTPINRWGKAIDSINGIAGDSKEIEEGVTRYYYWSLYIMKDNSTKWEYANEYATAYKASDISGVKMVWDYMDYEN